MKKDEFYSHKHWLVLTVIAVSLVMFSFSSVRAADHRLESNEVEVWTSSGYKAVTVGDSPNGSSLAVAPQEECVLNPTGMVSHWPLDEQSGASTFVDVVSSINGTCAGDACPSKAFGKVGGAYTFVASEQDVISVPADVNPGKAIYDTMVNGNFSAGVWVKTTQECTTELIENKVFFGRYREEPPNGTWWLGCTIPEGKDYSVAVFRLRDSSNNARQINGTSKINDGQWHYVVGVRDAGLDKNTLYVDGELEGLPDTTPYISAIDKFNSDDPITMGAYDEFTNYYLNGSLDEVVLYDRVVPGTEIGTYYDACKTVSPLTLTYLPIMLR